MGVNLKGVIKSTLISVLISFVIIFILALLAYFTGINENIITACAYASVIIGILVGSILVAMSAPNKKLLHVLLVCVLYTVILIGVSFALNGAVTFNSHMAAIVGGIFAAAFLGLIIGNR